MKIPEINERIEQLIDYYADGRVSRFANLLPGISQQRLNRLFNIDSRTGKYPIATTDILTEITNKFVDINADWLLTGRGEKFKTADNRDEKRPSEYPTNKNSGIVISDISAHCDSGTENIIAIPIVDILTVTRSGNYNKSYRDKANVITLPYSFLQNGVHYCIKVHEQSMMPTLQDGSYIIIRLLGRSEWVSMKDEGIYVISTRTGNIYIKRIRNRLRERGFIVCTSDNPDKAIYPDFQLTEKEFSSVWSVEWCLSARMPNIQTTYDNKLQKLDNDMADIKAVLARLLMQAKV